MRRKRGDIKVRKQTFEEYKEAREEALEELHNFLKHCEERNFTVQQLEIIGNCANEEIQKAIANMHTQTRFSTNLCDLPRCNDE